MLKYIIYTQRTYVKFNLALMDPQKITRLYMLWRFCWIFLFIAQVWFKFCFHSRFIAADLTVSYYVKFNFGMQGLWFSIRELDWVYRNFRLSIGVDEFWNDLQYWWKMDIQDEWISGLSILNYYKVSVIDLLRNTWTSHPIIVSNWDSWKRAM